MFGLGSNEMLVVLLIVLILFGGSKIPELMRGLGEGMREFRKATYDGDTGNGSDNNSSTSNKI